MSNYKITFYLENPVSFIHRPTFDGVLAYAYAKETLGEVFTQRLSIPGNEILDFSLMPINQHSNGWFLASSLMFDELLMPLQFIEKWRKRFDTKHAHLVNKPSKIPINRGQFKSYDVPFELRDIPKVWFYFQSEYIEQVEYLLQRHIAFLGKKRAYGNGLIRDFRIEETDFDFKGAYRPIPKNLFDMTEVMQDGSNFCFAYCAWKPPYWMPDNFTDCVCP